MSFAKMLEKYMKFKNEMKLHLERRKIWIEMRAINNGFEPNDHIIDDLTDKYFWDKLEEIKYNNGFEQSAKQNLLELRGMARELKNFEEFICNFEYSEEE